MNETYPVWVHFERSLPVGCFNFLFCSILFDTEKFIRADFLLCGGHRIRRHQVVDSTWRVTAYSCHCHSITITVTVKLLVSYWGKFCPSANPFIFACTLRAWASWNFHISFKSVKHCCIYTSAVAGGILKLIISGDLRLSPPPLRSLQLSAPAPAHDSARAERGNNWWKYHRAQVTIPMVMVDDRRKVR